MKIINYEFEMVLGQEDRIRVDFDMDDEEGRILILSGYGKFTHHIVSKKQYESEKKCRTPV